MTTIGSGAPRVVTTSTQSTQSAAQPATAQPATQQPAAQGYGTKSSFSAASGGGSSIAQTMGDARAVLDKVDGGGELSKLLTKQIPQRKELEKAIEEYDKLLQSGSLSDDERKVVEKAIAFQMMGRTLSDDIQRNFEKLIDQIKSGGR